MSSRSRLQRRPSTVSLWSMRELSPSPATSPELDIPGSWTNSPPPSHSIPGPLHTPVWWLTRTQKYSSYAFLTFMGVHFTTTGAAPLLTSLQTTNSSLLLARDLLHQPALETLLIPGALGLHVASGIALRVYRQSQLKTRYGGRVPYGLSLFRWKAFSGRQIAGWVFLPLVVAHAVFARGVPWWLDGDSSMIGIEWVGYGFRRGVKMGVGLTVGYVALVGAGVWHVLEGVSEYWGVRTRKVLGGVGVLVGGVWLGGLARVVGGSSGVGKAVERHYGELHKAVFGFA